MTITSSPGSVSASSVAAMASVAPAVTRISVSGSYSVPYRSRCRAIAARSSGRPGPGGYWFAPPNSAFFAASSIPAGPSVSGNPWPRLTASCRTASAVISAKMVEVNGRRRGTRAGSRTISHPHGQW